MPAGDLTPCPVSNVATYNLKIARLHECFGSLLFRKICENKCLLENEECPAPCLLIPKEVEEFANSVGAYRTRQ